ncbi:hypothetical protein BJF95_02775 [Rhizobium oryziradicis]|uniref:DUF2946 domain-containing protein n=2 Tax=Rhizobium oryziradicis TaxID=1867956 RepID=A0A1Q8ZVU1_9HYPH|nr:hypothetical protein BJF95_02775 [Rhizobium oryziradicis]
MLIFAALAYGAMPLNGMAMQHINPVAQDQSPMMHKHADDGASSLNILSSHDRDCGDKHNMFGCGHCAACLTLPAFYSGLTSRAFLHGAPLPALGHQLFSQNSQPLLPPPRA